MEMKIWGTLACIAFVVVCYLIIHHVQAKKAARGEDVISPFVRHFDNGANGPSGSVAPNEADKADGAHAAAAREPDDDVTNGASR